MIMKTQEETNSSEYTNPENWHFTLYASKKDSRIVVPSRGRQRVKTVNFAKPAGVMIHVVNVVVLTFLAVAVYLHFFAK